MAKFNRGGTSVAGLTSVGAPSYANSLNDEHRTFERAGMSALDTMCHICDKKLKLFE